MKWVLIVMIGLSVQNALSAETAIKFDTETTEAIENADSFSEVADAIGVRDTDAFIECMDVDAPETMIESAARCIKVQ